MKQFTFQEAQQCIFDMVPSSVGSDYSKGYGLERIVFVLNKLDLPQEKLKVIHIAGTSGKGSTASFISKILQNLGYKTGLTVSPHVINIRERIQINNTPISENLFARYFSEIKPYLDASKHAGLGSLSYFETLIVLAYYTFYKEKVDYAVIETGLGGTLDATNVIHNPQKLAVITKIGYDHMNILGNTLKEIAENKAGIIQKHQTVLYLDQPVEINEVILARAKQTESQTYAYNNDYEIDYQHVIYKLQDNTNIRIDKGDLPIFQLENLGIALDAICILSQRDGFQIDNQKVQEVTSSFSFLGRFDKKLLKGKEFILDGAHNPQKMNAFVSSLVKNYPKKKYVFIFACKQNKDYEALLKSIVPLADKIHLTQFEIEQDMVHKSVSPRALAVTLEKLNFQDYEIFSDPKTAILESLNYPSEPIVITGSFFLISNIYELFS